MAKKVLTLIKLQIPGGQANPAPPVGPALGQHGVNIMEFCKAFNAQTQQENGRITPVEITVYEDRSFTFITKTPPAAVLIKEALTLEKGSAEPNRTRSAGSRQAQLRAIAETKMHDLNARDVDQAMLSSPARRARWAWRWRLMAQHGKKYSEARGADRPRAGVLAARGDQAAEGAATAEVRRDRRGALPAGPERPPRRPAAPRHADAPARHRQGAARRRLRRGRQGERGRGGRRRRRRRGRPRERDRGAASPTSTSPSRRPTRWATSASSAASSARAA